MPHQYDKIKSRDKDDIKQLIHFHLISYHQGQAKRVDRWTLTETVTGQPIPASERNNNHAGQRLVRMAISDLRKEGELICSDSSGGYWYAATQAEALSTCDEIESQIRGMAETLAALKNNARARFGGQLRMM